MAEVFLSKLEGLDGFERKFAVKRILPHHSQNEGFVEMFKDEARLVSRLSHPNIVQTFEFGKVGDSYYLSMEYVDGVSVADIMTYHKRRKLPVPLMALVEIGIQICRGIDYAHRETDDSGEPLGIIHRDLTPHNILVSRKGIVKITDFGIAKASMNTHLTQAGMIKGKVPYMSPEQAMGLKLTHVSDIFSVGIVLYEMCCLERLFQGDNDFVTLQRVQEAVIPSIKEKRPDVPDALAAAILKALARDREARYRWASELESDLTRIKFQLAEAFQSFDLSTFVERIYQSAQEAPAESPRKPAVSPAPPAGTTDQVQAGLSEIAKGLSDWQGELQIHGSHGGAAEQNGNEEDQKTVLLASHPPSPPSAPPEQPTPKPAPSQPTLESPASSRDEDTAPRPVQAGWRSPRTIALGALLLLAMLGATAYWMWSASRGSIVVEVDPPDAEVFFNGVEVEGDGRFLQTGLKAGEQVEIAVEKPGYKPFRQTLAVQGGTRQRVPVQLARQTRTLELETTPPGATVYLSGHATDWTTPCRLELPPGKFAVALVKKGFERYEVTIDVSTLKQDTMAVELRPEGPPESAPAQGR